MECVWVLLVLLLEVCNDSLFFFSIQIVHIKLQLVIQITIFNTLLTLLFFIFEALSVILHLLLMLFLHLVGVISHSIIIIHIFFIISFHTFPILFILVQHLLLGQISIGLLIIRVLLGL